MSLSADGRLLVYSAYTPGANIWSIPIPPSGVASVADATQLTFGSEQIEKLAVSPDGRWLAFDSDREGQSRRLEDADCRRTGGTGDARP